MSDEPDPVWLDQQRDRIALAKHRIAEAALKRKSRESRCWILAEKPAIDEAHDGRVFFVEKDAERICGNLIVNTGRPYKVWLCRIVIADPGEGGRN